MTDCEKLRATRNSASSRQPASDISDEAPNANLVSLRHTTIAFGKPCRTMTAQLKKQPKGKARRGRPPQTAARETRLKLMRSAAEEFSRAEYSDVSLEAIARNVGLSPTAIYNHFASKDELFFETITSLMRSNLTAIEEAIRLQSDWRSQLRAVLDLIKRDETGWFRFPLLTPAAQLKLMQNRDQFSEVLDLRAAFVAQFLTIINGASVAGDLPQSISTKPTAELLMGFVFNGLSAAMSHRNDEEGISQLIDGFEAMLGLHG